MTTKIFTFIFLAGIIIFSACEKNVPSASFTHSSGSYEEGDTVYFTSTSSKANSFQWDFGDGSTSTDENPYHIYSTTGTYEVSLKVTGEDGSDEAKESITIKDPTILAFIVTEGTTTTVISGCLVTLFESEADLNNLENIAFIGLTDSDGYVEFYHLKGIVYYVFAAKEVTNGLWGWVGSLPPIDLNEFNGYYLQAEFIPSKKSVEDLNPDLVKSLMKKSPVPFK